MSYEVDNRVVSMEFDNEEFEKRVKQSQGSLEKLKNSLNFEESSKSVNNLQNEINKFDVSGITKGIDTLENRFSVFGTFAGRIVENFADGIYSKVSGALRAIPNQIKNGGWARTKNTEGAKFLLEGILEGDPQETKKTIQSIIDGQVALAVNDTAFGADEASKIAANLIASDVKYDTSKVNKDWLDTFASSGQAVSEVKDQLDDLSLSLMAISGVASMTNSGYQEIGDIFTKVKAAGKAQMMQISQLTQRGLPAIQALADYMQVTAEDISEYSRKGLIDYDTFVNAMFDAYADQAKRADDTFEGSMANMKSALSRIGQKFLTPIYNNMTRVFKSLKGLINRVNAQLTPIAEKFGTIFEGLTIKVSDFINKSLDASLITSAVRILVRAFDLLLSVIKPIGEAMAEVFGGNGFLVGLKQANVAISRWLKTITLTTKEQEKFKNVLVGLFKIVKSVFTVIINVGRSAFNILRGVFNIIYGLFTFIAPILSGIGGIFKDIIQGIASLLKIKLDGSGLVSFTKSFAELTSHFRASDKYRKTISKFFAGLSNVFKKLGAVLKPIAEMIGIVFGGIIYLAKGLIDMLPPLEWFTDMIKGAFEYVKAFAMVIGEKLAPALGGVKDFFAPMTNTLGTWRDELKMATEDIGDSILKGESLQKIFEKIRNTKITPPDLEELSKRVDKVTKKLQNVWNKVKKIVKNVVDVMKDFFVNQYNQMKDMTFAEHLSNIFMAIFAVMQTFRIAGGDARGGILGFAKLIESITGVFKGAGMLERGIKGVFKSITGSFREVTALIKVKVIHAYVTAILELVAALVVLSFIPTDKLSSALVAISVLMGGLMLFIKVLDIYEKALSHIDASSFNKTALAFSASIFLLSEALYTLTKIDYDKLGNTVKAFGALVALAGAVMIFVLAWEKLHKVFFATSGNGGKGGITGMINNSFSIFSAKGIKLWGVNILAFAAGVKILIGVFKELAAVKDWDQYGTPFLIILSLFGAFAVLSKVASKDMLEVGIGILFIAIAFKKFGTIIESMVNTFKDVENVGKVIKLLAATLGFFTLALGGMLFVVHKWPDAAKGIKQIAFAVLILAGAMAVLTALDTKKLLSSVAILSGFIVVLGALAAVAGGIPIIEAGLIAIGFAFKGIGLGVLSAAAGFAIFVIAASLLAGSLAAIAAAITLAAPLIQKALMAIVDVVIGTLDYLLQAIAEHGESIGRNLVLALSNIAVGVLNGLALILEQGFKEIGIGIASFMEKIPGLKGLGSKWKEKLQGELTPATADAVTGAAKDASSKIDGDAIATSIGSGGLFGKLKEKLGLNKLFGSGDAEGAASIQTMVNNLGAGINTNMAGIDLSQATTSLQGAVGGMATDAFDLNSNTALSNVFTTFGTDSTDLIGEGMTENTDSLEDAANSNVDTYTKEVKSSENQEKNKKAGKYTVSGIVKGLTSEEAKAELIKAANLNADTYLKAYNDRQVIKSPSRRMKKSGRFTVQGLIEGFKEMRRPLEATASDVADSAYYSMAYALDAINASINSDLVASPTVYPVLDMSDVYYGMNQINSMIGSQAMALNTSAELATSIETSGVLGFSQQLSKSNQSLNADTIRAINNIQGDISRLEDAILNMGFYINDGALVGQIVGGIDRQLGVRQGYKGRNM